MYDFVHFIYKTCEKNPSRTWPKGNNIMQTHHTEIL